MDRPRSGFVNIDELMAQVSLDQVAGFYGVELPELHRTGEEVRTRCFLNCGQGEQTGDRALAIKIEHPAKQWRCHQYGCGRGGNVVSLCDLLKPGTNMNGRPRGERFKAIVKDLRAMVSGTLGESTPAVPTEGGKVEEPQLRPNVRLGQSGNERARALVNLDDKFVVEPEKMSPKAASYFRKRPFLTPEVCRKYRMGYLPRDVGGDRVGGTMRGKIMYAMRNEDGEVLAWAGRDPDYAGKEHKWLAGGQQGREPAKWTFPKGYHRGQEIYGQEQWNDQTVQEKIREIGVLLLVEGPNDRIALQETHGAPAYGICSNRITAHQAKKVADKARKLGVPIGVMFDCDVEGDNGAKQAIWELAQQRACVRLPWSRSMQGGKFADRQPESLTEEEWGAIRSLLLTRAGNVE